MKLPWNNKDETTIDENIDAAQTALFSETPGTSQYAAVLSHLEALYKLKNLDKGFKVSPDTIVMVAANLLGIVLVLNYEKTGVVASKAFGLVQKAFRS